MMRGPGIEAKDRSANTRYETKGSSACKSRIVNGPWRESKRKQEIHISLKRRAAKQMKVRLDHGKFVGNRDLAVTL